MEQTERTQQDTRSVGQAAEQAHGQTNGQTNGQANGQTNGQTNGQADGMTALTADPTATPKADLTTLLAGSLPREVCDWLGCLRTSGVSLSYSVEKRHIPDVNSDGRAESPPAHGQNRDTMTLGGELKVRYFDLALGIVGLLLAGCALKGLCRIGRHLF